MTIREVSGSVTSRLRHGLWNWRGIGSLHLFAESQTTTVRFATMYDRPGVFFPATANPGRSNDRL